MDVTKKGEKLKEDMDKLMNKIDDVLEENAEEFVKHYVQKGGGVGKSIKNRVSALSSLIRPPRVFVAIWRKIKMSIQIKKGLLHGIFAILFFMATVACLCIAYTPGSSVLWVISGIFLSVVGIFQTIRTISFLLENKDFEDDDLCMY
ncbi:ubiquitin-like protein Pup [Candidatus Azambacteria bacterium]|nr:ubiquitin-like protein Pup [Candidatus Azambacteria bacterium]